MATDSISGLVTNKGKWDKSVRTGQDLESSPQWPQPHDPCMPLAGLKPSGVERALLNQNRQTPGINSHQRGQGICFTGCLILEGKTPRGWEVEGAETLAESG